MPGEASIGSRIASAALRTAPIHLAVGVCFVALALWLTFPLVAQLGSSIPGDGPGDNVCFLWNTWWFRHSLARQSLGLWTDAIAAPFGTSLALHTHTLLPTAIGVVALPAASAIESHNAVLLLGLFANGAVTYALGFYYSGRVLPSLAGGITFAWCAYVSTHLLGHINLVHAWVIPLFALALTCLLAAPSAIRAVVMGSTLALVSYADYYYTIYCLIFLGIACLSIKVSIVVRRRERDLRRAVMISMTLAVLLALLGLAVQTLGGTVLEIGGMTVSIRSTRNIVAAVGLLLAAAAAMRYSLHLAPINTGTPLPTRRHWLEAAVCYVTLVAPLIYAIAQLAIQGEYVSQRVLWRSSPAGIDVSTLLLGPPNHILTGEWTQARYRALGIDSIEQSGWLGILPLLAIYLTTLGERTSRETRIWLFTAGIFFVLSLGPFLRLLGSDTGLPLPYAVLRYVPVFSNARMPGRAVVMVQLATAMLTVLALSRRRTQPAVLGAWTVLLVLEMLPGPTPLYQVPAEDRVDMALRQSQIPGSVLELPTGLRDGFGEHGYLDHRLLVHQISHERPVVGGFVARLSPTLLQSYMESPFLAGALESSRNPPVEGPCPLSAAEARSKGVAYLVVNRDRFARKGPFSRESLESASFRFVTVAGDRELYATR